MIKRIFDKICLKLYLRGKNIYETEQYDQFRKKYNLAATFRFNGSDILFYGEGKIIIGEGSYIGSLSTIQAFDNGKCNYWK